MKVPGSGSTALSHVTLYNKGVEKFEKYKGRLPFNIRWSKKADKEKPTKDGKFPSKRVPMDNKSIIRRFGDTPIKGGGTVNVFMTYNELGIG